jgi:23S rRNA (uridine2552-2'-O)-methyltransferase
MRIERRKDFYYHKAKKEHFPARSVYKLEELNKKLHIIKAGGRILDIGCAPGSWCKYARAVAGKNGIVVGIDILPVQADIQKDIVFLQKDLFTLTAQDLSHIGTSFDCVMSDAAPNTSGDRFTDHQRSLRICEKVFELSGIFLKPGGNLLMKVFQGEDYQKLYKEVGAAFKACKTEKPQSSRKESFEVYIVGLHKL